MKQDIKIIVFKEDCEYKIPTSPVEFMQFWADKINIIPEEFINTATIEIDIEDDYGFQSLILEISYTRPETNQEYESRIFKERQMDDKLKQKELKLLKLLKELSEKYEKESL